MTSILLIQRTEILRPQIVHFLQMLQVEVQHKEGVLDRFSCPDEHEGNLSPFVLVFLSMPFAVNFNADDPTFVHDVLDGLATLTNHLAYHISRDLERLFRKFQDLTSFVPCLRRLCKDLYGARFTGVLSSFL